MSLTLPLPGIARQVNLTIDGWEGCVREKRKHKSLYKVRKTSISNFEGFALGKKRFCVKLVPLLFSIFLMTKDHSKGTLYTLQTQPL